VLFRSDSPSLAMKFVPVLFGVCLVLLWTSATALYDTVYLGGDEIMVIREYANHTQASIHTLQRKWPSCDYVAFPAKLNDVMLRDAVWGEKTTLNQTAMAYLGNRMVYVHNIHSGQYVVRNCSEPVRSQRNPCPVYGSARDPSLSLTSQRSLFYAGSSRTLAYNHVTGDFDMLAFDADVHGSGAIFHQIEGSIFSGRFNFSGRAEFAYLQSDHHELMATHFIDDHTVMVWTYNSSARSFSEMAGRVMATGNVSSPNQKLRGLGHGDMMLLDSLTSSFEVWRVADNSSQISLATVATGTLETGRVCSTHVTREKCVGESVCGWCAADQTCHAMADQTHYCDGGSCHTTNVALGKFWRVPYLHGASRDSGITPLVSPFERELDMDDEYHDMSLTDEHTIHELSRPPTGSALEAHRIQLFFTPPHSEGVNCMTSPDKLVKPPAFTLEEMNKAYGRVRYYPAPYFPLQHPLVEQELDAHADQKNCTRLLRRLEPARDIVRQDAPQGALATRSPPASAPALDTSDPLLTMQPDYMNVGQPETGSSDSDVDIVEVTNTTATAAGLHPIRMEEGEASLEVVHHATGSDMEMAMQNFGLFHDTAIPWHLPPEQQQLALFSMTSSPTATVTPSLTPSATASPSPSISLSASATPSPSQRSWPCSKTDEGLLNESVLACNRCSRFVWAPSDPSTHLMPLPSPLDC